MAAFRASEALEALEYDFTPHVDAHGIIPEPSSGQVEEMFDQLRGIVADLGLAYSHSPEENIAALANAPEDALSTVNTRMLAALHVVCGDTPSRGQLEALPHRLRQAFMGWLFAQLGDPQSFSVATTPSPAASNGAGRSISSAVS